MALINRGRLSVQRVDEQVWDVVKRLAERGGWEKDAPVGKKGGKQAKKEIETETDTEVVEDTSKPKLRAKGSRKRKAEDTEDEIQPKRRSAREKRAGD
jgi:hypothetical protein